MNKKPRYRNAIMLLFTFVMLSLVFESFKPNSIFGSAEQQGLTSPFPAKHYSAIDRSDAVASESLQKYKSRMVQTPVEETKNVTIVDYAEPSSPQTREEPFSISATDPCGDGSNQFTTESVGVRWQTFPVTYAIDTTNSGVDPTTARNAVIQTFQEFDAYIPGQAFSLINDFNAAKIKFKWEFIDGAFGQVGFASFSFSTPSLALTSATITLDSGENWFVSPVHRCSSSGNSLDIQNVASHELGHAVGLGHVSDNLLTLFPTSFAGETLKRSLGTGDIAGLNSLYPVSNTWSDWNSLSGLVREGTNPAIIKNSDGRLQAFVIGTNNQLYYKSQTAAGSSTWSSGWTSLGGGIKENTSPVTDINADGRLQAFVVGNNDQLYDKLQTAASQ